MSQPQTRNKIYKVAACPACKGKHDFTIVVTSRRLERPPVFFGGKTEKSTTWDVTFHCPKRDKAFVSAVPILFAPDEDIMSVEEATDSLQESVAMRPFNTIEAHDWLEAELADRIKASAQPAQDFSKTLITTSSGAVAVYFLIFKYLGVEAMGKGWARFGLLPPLLFLSAAVVFVIGIRPTLIRLSTSEDYGAIRDARMRRLNWFITAGLSLFLAGLGLAATIWTFRVLGRF